MAGQRGGAPGMDMGGACCPSEDFLFQPCTLRSTIFATSESAYLAFFSEIGCLKAHFASFSKMCLGRNDHWVTPVARGHGGHQDSPYFIKPVLGNVCVFLFTVLLPGKIIQAVCESPVEVVKSEEVDSTLQTVDLNEGGDATPEPTEVRLKREERKPPRTLLMTFLRQMVSPLLPAGKAGIPRSASESEGPVSGGVRRNCRG